MISVYVLPPQLPASPYMDRLYTPLAQQASDIELRRGRARVELLRLLLGRGPRILHLHFFDELTQRPGQLVTALRSLAFVLLLWLLRMRGVGLIWTAHNIMPHELYHPRWANFVYRQVARYSTVIITHSEAARSAVREHYLSSIAPQQTPPDCVVIPHGHYIGHYGPIQERKASRALLGLHEHGPVTLCLGALRPYKHIEGLIAAFASLPAPERGTLLIAGWAKDQHYAHMLQAHAAQVSGVRLELRYIADSDMATYLGAANIVALPYHRLLTSGVLLLALSYARPVLAPDLDSVRELIQDGQTGFLFQPDTPTSLAQCLQRALTETQHAQLDAQALASATAFDWEQIAEQLAVLYHKVGVTSDG